MLEEYHTSDSPPDAALVYRLRKLAKNHESALRILDEIAHKSARNPIHTILYLKLAFGISIPLGKEIASIDHCIDDSAADVLAKLESAIAETYGTWSSRIP